MSKFDSMDKETTLVVYLQLNITLLRILSKAGIYKDKKGNLYEIWKLFKSLEPLY